MADTTTNRAQTDFLSIGLLLALVIVAAVAFGVFLNTVAFLQDNNAESQVEDLIITDHTVSVNDPDATTVEVSDRTGDEGAPVVYELRVELQHPPNGSEVALTDLQVELEGDAMGILHHISENVETNQLDPEGDVDGIDVARDVFFIESVAVQERNGVLASGDRYELVIPVGVFVGSDGELQLSPTRADRVVEPERDYENPDVVTPVPDILTAGEGIDNSAIGLLEAGDTVSIRIASEGGIEKTVEIDIPSSIENHGGETVSL